MEASKVVSIVESSRENGSSSDGRPPIPNPLAVGTAYQYCLSSGNTPLPCTKSLLRHPSLVKTRSSNISIEPRLNLDDSEIDFIPILRSGAWSDIGIRPSMEDVYVCADNLMLDYGFKKSDEGPNAFYGVFDGHGGKHAADFACYHLPSSLLRMKISLGRLRE